MISVQKKRDKLKKLAIAVVVVQIILLILFVTVLSKQIFLAGFFLVVEGVGFFFLFDRFDTIAEEETTHVKDVLGESAQEAYLFAQLGMVMYDDTHTIVWMSDLFQAFEINRIGQKVLEWLPEVSELMSGVTDCVKVQLDEQIYEITKMEDEPILFFKDVTLREQYRVYYEESCSVIGMASFDNYEESTQYEDEAVVSSINVAVRTPLIEYCRQHGILVKRINSYRYLLVLNEKIFNQLAAEHFSILNTVRKAAQKQEVSITLSMAFARGTENYEELDEMVVQLLDLAQSRGGDQVTIKKKGEDVVYFGGSTEATEKRSKVRVRVMAHTLRELISRSSNVIICGHKEADFDCMGAAIGTARITQALRKPTVIISKTGGLEEKLKNVMTKNHDVLNEEFTFVTESEALNKLQEKTLVIMVDHHSLRQSNGGKVLESAKTVAILDHHRRSSEMGVKPVLIYIEAGASSTCELVTELFPYISNRIEITPLDATIMLTGMTIDTGHFRVRTGARTFDAASQLRRFGADPLEVDEYLKDSYEEFSEKTRVMAMSQNYSHGIIITPVKDIVLTRSKMSQVADSLLEIQGVEAAFVLANNIDDQTAISARSNGKINVQIIMEKMHGGGHLTAAAMQRPKTNINDVMNELRLRIDEYFKEVEENEGHFEK